jgi:uncharacterized protein (DUF4213/DUF364 family)
MDRPREDAFMQLVQDLYDLFYPRALKSKVVHLCIGLRYTAVATDDGGTGVAFTSATNGRGCPKPSDYRDFEGQPASELLERIKSPSGLDRSMALALINALNCHAAKQLPQDPSDSLWMEAFGIGAGSRVAMVGLFRPLVKALKARGSVVEVIDQDQGVGDKGRFYEKLGHWAQVLVLTATSILNDSSEEVLGRIGPGVKTIMIGPSTPLAAQAFARLPVRVLAGTVPANGQAVLRAVRHGAGTPVIHRFSRKVYVTLPDPAPPEKSKGSALNV